MLSLFLLSSIDTLNKFKNIKNVQLYIFSLKSFFIHNNNYYIILPTLDSINRMFN